MRLGHLYGNRRIENILGRRPPVDITCRRLATQGFELVEHWHQRMLREGNVVRQLLDIEQRRIRLALDHLGGGGGNHAQFRLRFGQRDLNIQPALQGRRIAPDALRFATETIGGNERFIHSDAHRDSPFTLSWIDLTKVESDP